METQRLNPGARVSEEMGREKATWGEQRERLISHISLAKEKREYVSNEGRTPPQKRGEDEKGKKKRCFLHHRKVEENKKKKRPPKREVDTIKGGGRKKRKE